MTLLLALIAMPAVGCAQEDDPATKPPAPQRNGWDWPAFLGPQHDGTSAETGLNLDWAKNEPPIVWSRLVGTGYSAPSVRGNRLVLHHRIGREEVLHCYRADIGDILWRTGYPSRFTDPYGYNNGPRCTPLLTDDRCYTLGAEGVLLCTDLTSGEEIWKRELKQEFDIVDGFFGVGATPILEGDRLIVLVGGQPNSGVVAFDAASGETLWESVGQQTWDGVKDSDGEPYEWIGEEMVVSYSSPVAANIHGKRHVLCLMRQGLVSVDPATGRENFRYWFRSKVHDSVNAARPVVVNDTILLSAAYRLGSVRLQVAKDGGSVSELWRSDSNLLAHWSTPIHHEGYYYGFSGRHEREGELRCLNADTGEVVWRSDGWEKPLDAIGRGADGGLIDRESGESIPWPFYGRGSCILADGQLIVLGERGTLAVVQATPEKWIETVRMPGPEMKYPSWTAPVLSRGRLFLRCEDALVCLHLQPAE